MAFRVEISAAQAEGEFPLCFAEEAVAFDWMRGEMEQYSADDPNAVGKIIEAATGRVIRWDRPSWLAYEYLLGRGR